MEEKLKVVKILKNNKLGILMIPERDHHSFYSLNSVLTEDNELMCLMGDDFEIIGELDND